MEYWPLVEKSSYDMTAIATVATAVTTLVVAVVTALMVRATNRIAKVSERTLKAGTTPQVIAYLKNHFHDRLVPDVTVVLENVGQGTAQNVRYQMNFEDEAGQQNANRHFIANRTELRIDFLPQGAKRETMLGRTDELYDASTDSVTIAPFRVTVWYENLEGEPQGEQFFTLDVRDFADIGGEQISSLVSIGQSFQNIERHIQNIEQHLGGLTQRRARRGQGGRISRVP